MAKYDFIFDTLEITNNICDFKHGIVKFYLKYFYRQDKKK